MNVTIVTPLRDAAAHWPGYVRRLAELDYDADKLRLVLVEGDSVDGTQGLVQEWAERWQRRKGAVTVVTCNTGRPKFGSVVDPERFWTLATVFNAGLEAVDLAWSDDAMLLPVDIVYDPDLLRRLLAWEVDAVCPLTWMGGLFYDTWALSRDGHFFPPFSRETAADLFHEQLTEMTTIGGTMLFRAELLRAGVRYGLVDVDRDFSRDARAAGFRLWLDPTTHVWHGERE